MARRASRSRGTSGGQNLPPLSPLPDIPPLPDLTPLPDIPPLPDLAPLSRLDDLGSPGAAERAVATERQLLGGAAAMPNASSEGRFAVNSRTGLRLRSGPDQSFAAIKTLPFGTVVVVLKREGEWAQVDLEGDGAADGFVHGSFLESAGSGSSGRPQGDAGSAIPVGNDILEDVTPEKVKSTFPAATPLANIKKNLPFVLAGLRAMGLVDKPMVLMAVATIRAETEGFVPISEGRSRFNTLNTPFDLYDAGTSIGQTLGNTERGDGPFFKGRGYIQLTGRSNYTSIGRQIGQPLATQPELANDPTIAGVILAQFLKNKDGAIRRALAASDLRLARKLVNGGSHGLDRFTDTFNRGMTVLPG